MNYQGHALYFINLIKMLSAKFWGIYLYFVFCFLITKNYFLFATELTVNNVEMFIHKWHVSCCSTLMFVLLYFAFVSKTQTKIKSDHIYLQETFVTTLRTLLL